MYVRKAPSIATTDGKFVEGKRVVVPDVVFCGGGIELAIDVSLVYSETESRCAPLYKSGKEVYSIVKSVMTSRANAKAVKYKAACARDA